MDEDTEGALDWNKHEDEISDLFVTQKKTLKEVMEHMESTHNFMASERQYKFRFSNRKNVKVDEWVWIGREIEQRKAEGKKSVPCLLKRPLPEDRVARETARHKRKISEALKLSALRNPAPDRISIESPSPIMDASEANTECSGDSTDPQVAPELQVPHIQSPPELALLEALRQESTLWLDMETGNQGSFNFGFQSLHGGAQMDEINWSEIGMPSPTTISIHTPNPHASPQDIHQIAPIPPSHNSQILNSQPSFHLFKNLPWFRFQDVLEQYGMAVEIDLSILDISDCYSTAHNMISVPSVSDGQHSTTSTISINLSIDIRRVALLGLVGSMLALPDHHHSSQPRLELHEAHQLIPERYEGQLSKTFLQILDPSTSGPSSISLILSLAAYFASNNALDEARMDNFVKWIMDQKCAVYLIRFLQINTSTAHAFAPQILKSAIRLQSIKLLTALLDLGVSFKTILPDIFLMGDSKFMRLALSKAKPSWFTGDAGTRLLHLVLDKKDYDLAQILIDNEVDLDARIDKCTALYRRVASDDVLGVSFLLDRGANVDKLSFPETNMDFIEWAPLAEAALRKRLDIFTMLLEHDASLNCLIHTFYTFEAVFENLIKWTSINFRQAYLLLKKLGRVNNSHVDVGDLLDAASRGRYYFEAFMERNKKQITATLFEEALNRSIVLPTWNSTVVLLQHGVTTNHTRSNQTLWFATHRVSGARRRTLCELLLRFDVDVGLPTILEAVVDDVYLLQKFVESGADIHEQGPSALIKAVENGHGASAAFLLDRGVDINTPGLFRNPLQAAASKQRLDMMEFLLGEGADMNAPPYPVNGRTALQASLENVNPFPTTELLLDRGADVSAEPAIVHGLTALEAVCHNWVCGDTDRLAALCNRLLDAGVPVNRPNMEPSFAIHGAISHGWDDILDRMLEPQRGAIVNHVWCQKTVVDEKTKERQVSEGAMTPLQLAAGLVRPKAIRRLLESGADVNEAPAPEFGRTTLQRATSTRLQDIETVHFLLDKGAAINAKPAVHGGITALQGAAIAGHIMVAKLLIEKGAEVNAAPAPFEGRYAIEGAAEHGRLDMIQLLLNAGAKGNISRRTGFKFAIELAEKNEHFAIANLLKSYS